MNADSCDALTRERRFVNLHYKDRYAYPIAGFHDDCVVWDDVWITGKGLGEVNQARNVMLRQLLDNSRGKRRDFTPQKQMVVPRQGVVGRNQPVLAGQDEESKAKFTRRVVNVTDARTEIALNRRNVAGSVAFVFGTVGAESIHFPLPFSNPSWCLPNSGRKLINVFSDVIFFEHVDALLNQAIAVRYISCELLKLTLVFQVPSEADVVISLTV